MGIEAISNYTVYETSRNKEAQQPKETQLPAAEMQTENAIQSEDDGVIVDIVDIQNAGNTQVEDTQEINKTAFNYKSFYFCIWDSTNASQIIDAIDRTAAIYAYTKFQLQKNYSGDELTQQVAGFDQYFSDILDSYYTVSYKQLDRLNKYGEVISDDTIKLPRLNISIGGPIFSIY